MADFPAFVERRVDAAVLDAVLDEAVFDRAVFAFFFFAVEVGFLDAAGESCPVAPHANTARDAHTTSAIDPAIRKI